MRWLGLFCRLAVGGIFIYASWDKLLHPAAFAAAVDHYHLVPYSLLHPMAYGLPLLELITGAALILGLYRRGAALLAGTLTMVFMIAIASALARGLDITCGCFHTDGGHAVGVSLLVRDLALLIMCLPPLLLADAGPRLAVRRKKDQASRS